MLTLTLAPGHLPSNIRIYAVGDVHGCAQKLRDLHADIAADLAARPVLDARLIHLGDYIDRGPDSADVVEHLVHGALATGLQVINLIGNHEQMMLAALSDMTGQMQRLWRRNGGDVSLRSWGISPDAAPFVWHQALPPAHVAWLKTLAPSYRSGSYFFVHAGVRPGIAIAGQKTDDLLWIREPFLSFSGDLGAIVVHGHTPAEKPAVRANRIGIDTGAVLGGKLTCLVLQDDQMGFLSR
jgi:serine/threonine protein phosphatase 1